MNMEPWWNENWQGKQVFGENLPQFRFVYHKSQWPDRWFNPGHRDEKNETSLVMQLKKSHYVTYI
jgi:hypothetical protein